MENTTDPTLESLDPELITRYLSGNATLPERNQVEQTLENPEALVRTWTAAQSLALPTGTSDTAFLERLTSQIRNAEQPGKPRQTPSARGLSSRRQWRAWHLPAVVGVVAVVLLVVAGPWFRSSSAGLPVATQIYQTNSGQRAQFILPDGSQVLLGPESQLSYTGAADRGARAIELQGEAVFQVDHASDRPFTIRAGSLTTQVLGTQFVVRAYPTDQSASVAVLDGKVAFGVGAPSTILVAGDVGKVAEGALVQVTHDVALSEIEAWTRGEFVMDEMPLREIAREIERQYGVRVRIDGRGLEQRTLTLAFTGHSLQGMLDIIATILGVRYTYDGHAVVLYIPSSRGE